MSDLPSPSPLPWSLSKVERDYLRNEDICFVLMADGEMLGICADGEGYKLERPIAELIVRAVNAHHPLVEALKAVIEADLKQFSPAVDRARELLASLEQDAQ